MTDIMKLADDYAECMYLRREKHEARAALQSAIEALQAECAELQSANDQLNDDCAMHMRVAVDAIDAKVVLMAERDTLQAKLDDLQRQEPVAHRAWFDADNGARWLFTLWPEEERLDVEWEPLYAAPKALEPEPLTDERQPLTKVLAAVREYLPTDGISAKDCLSKIIAIVDPWPLDAKPLIAMKDVELSLMAHNDDLGDWNDLRYRDCWHEGYKAGARAIEAAHGIGGTP